MSRCHLALLGAGLFLLAGAALCGGAQADTSDIRRADNGVSLDLGAANLDYAETAGGTVLDTEKGWLPTAHLGLGILAFDRAPIPDLYLRADLQGSLGKTAYDGALCDQFGNCVPATATTNDAIVTGAFQAGRAFPLGRSLMLIPFAELGYRYWDRNLKGTGGYPEHYQNWDALGGVLAQYSPATRWVLSLAGAGGSTFGAKMDLSGETFTLGSQAMWRAQGRIGYRLTDRLELTTSVDYVSFGYGASAPDANSYYEPDSTTHQTTLMLGASYHFF